MGARAPFFQARLTGLRIEDEEGKSAKRDQRAQAASPNQEPGFENPSGRAHRLKAHQAHAARIGDQRCRTRGGSGSWASEKVDVDHDRHVATSGISPEQLHEEMDDWLPHADHGYEKGEPRCEDGNGTPRPRRPIDEVASLARKKPLRNTSNHENSTSRIPTDCEISARSPVRASFRLWRRRNYSVLDRCREDDAHRFSMHFVATLRCLQRRNSTHGGRRRLPGSRKTPRSRGGQQFRVGADSSSRVAMGGIFSASTALR